MSTGAIQATATQTAPGRRTERILKIPPIGISLDVADLVLGLMHQVASERVDSEFRDRLRHFYNSNTAAAQKMDPEAKSEQDFVDRQSSNAGLKALSLLPSNEKYIFLSSTSNVQFDSPDFEGKVLPKDLNAIFAHADGINNRFIDIKLQCNFKDFNDATNWQLNQVVVQGEDANWVNATYEHIRGWLYPERFKTRGFVYENLRVLFWISTVLLFFAEYRAAKWLYPSFDLKAPLSGTGAILMFAVLTATFLVFGNMFIPAVKYWFPFFELEGNLTRSRTASRKFVVGIFMSIYSAAVLNVVLLVLGPAISRWIGGK